MGKSRIGYACISTADESLGLQLTALAKAKCVRIFEERTRLKITDVRPEFEMCLEALATGDTLIVLRLDRLARSLSELVKVVMDLEHRGIGLESIAEKINTRSSASISFLKVFEILAGFEHNLTRERTQFALKAGRARGHAGGAKRKLNAKQIQEIQRLLKDPATVVSDVAKQYGISRTTLYRVVGVVTPDKTIMEEK